MPIDKLLEALSRVEDLMKQGHRSSGIMGSPLAMAKRDLERAFGEFQRSY